MRKVNTIFQNQIHTVIYLSAFNYLKRDVNIDHRNHAHLGMILMKKEGTINEAREYLSKSCKLKSKKGCFGLGMIYEDVLNEKAKAQDAYNNSCRFGFKKACDINLEI